MVDVWSVLPTDLLKHVGPTLTGTACFGRSSDIPIFQRHLKHVITSTSLFAAVLEVLEEQVDRG